jgi:hypothetical protein
MHASSRPALRPALGAALAALAVWALPVAASAASKYTGSVVNDDPREGRKVEQLTIDLDRLSTPDELSALAAGSGKAAAIGSARLHRTLAQNVIAAVEVESEGKKKIVLVFDGPFRWFDARSTPSAKKYPHGVVEIELDGSGRGEGRLLAGAKVDFAAGGVEIGEAAGEPMRVIQVASAG